MDSLFKKKTKRKPGGVLVLYTSRHGATQRYAERIAEPMDALVKDSAYAGLDEAQTYDAIVMGCPVYAEKIKGLDFLAAHAGALADKRLVLFTCGLNDPSLPQVRQALEEQIREKLGEAAQHVQVFHLRGSIRWQSLGLVERLMMKAMVAGLKKKPAAERSETECLLIETEGGVLDFSDEADLEPVILAAQSGKEERA